MLKRLTTLCLLLATLGVSQTIQVPSPKLGRATEVLPWTRFYPRNEPYKPTDQERQQIQTKMDELGAAIEQLRSKGADEDLLLDVEIFHEAARWKMRSEREFFRAQSVGDTLSVLDKGMQRAKLLAQGESPWTTQTGQVVRGFRSAVDGSIQPVRITIPEEYDGSRAFPLDVAQHGRFTRLYEVEYLNSWQGAEIEYLPGTIQIDVSGRGKTAYHWPGETETFEAMEFVQNNYKIDKERMSLRGFSMGGAGVWHFALHYPDLWASMEVGSGDNQSHRMAAVEDLAPHQQAMTTIFDNMYQWILNVFNTNFIGYSGELDGSLGKHILARNQLQREGLHFEGMSFTTDGVHVVESPGVQFLVAPNTPHGFHEDFSKRTAEIHQANLKRGRQIPDHVRFLTYTTRYNSSFWVTLDGLEKHYVRADVNAKRSSDHKQFDITTNNLSRLLLREVGSGAAINIDGQTLSVTGGPEIALDKTDGNWSQGNLDEGPGLRKRHGLQGPIDDAFMEPFLVVRPTGTPWNKAANEQALRLLEQFDERYHIAFRGHMRMKDDTEVTEEDFEKYHVVLFGDPGSNRWIGELNGRLPVNWTKRSIGFGKEQFPANASLPALIYPNPLNPSRYVVINSGLTAEWQDWAGDFPTPQYGDFAVLRVSDKEAPDVAQAGIFDESWNLQ